MLWISFKQDNEHFNVAWYVGEKSPVKDIPYDDILEVFADGDELLYIIKNASNIPYLVKEREVPGVYSTVPIATYWRGENAIFIVRNLIADF